MAESFFEESKNLAPLVRLDDIYFGLLAAQSNMMPVSFKAKRVPKVKNV